MKNLRVLYRDIDPETGDVSYFKPGHFSRYGALDSMAKFGPPAKSRKARRKQRKKLRANRYAAYQCPPRPIFHTPAEDIEPAERWELKQEVFRRDKFTCQQCGSRQHLTLDHIIPKSRGGGWHLNNLQCLCETCNEAKADRMPYEQAA